MVNIFQNRTAPIILVFLSETRKGLIMHQFDEIWKLTVSELTEKFGHTVSDLWFPTLTLYDVNDKNAVIICDMPYKYGILKSKYRQFISEALQKVLGFSVEVIILDKTSNPEEYYLYVEEKNKVSEPVNLAEDIKGESSANSSENPAVSSIESKDYKEKIQSSMSGYNEYTFDTFIVGQSNKFAHAASVAVANEPSCQSTSESFTYNPLFIWGPSGLGKTHLLYSIINHIKNTRPQLKIVYVKGEEFTNQLIDCILKKTPEQFRDKYRTADILLIDDIQFIAGRDSTQEEFFHTFNALYEDHKQIILTSDRPPRDIHKLEDRIKTRFEWGIIADIQPPDADLRAAILKKKADSINIKLDNDVINFLADNLKNNIRQVEGAIKKLKAINLMTGDTITVEIAKNALVDLINDDGASSITPEKILDKVSKKFGVSPEDIKGPKRTKEIAYARHISAYLMKKLTDMTLKKIGVFLKRDHTTMISSLKAVEKELGANTQTDRDINELIKEING